jgi:4-amino-4-deoxy-L-arabinose transferase-like glycosyltransferase
VSSLAPPRRAPTAVPPEAAPQGPQPGLRASRWLVGLFLVGVGVAGVALRFVTRSDLWLDEALSANIAALPLGDLFDALARDGHPPLYYVLLHGWMQVVGEGDLAVRSLSGLVSVATLPVAWVAGRRYGGRVCAVATVVVLATSPFALRYATEARMYSLVMLLVLLGWLAVRSALEEPRPVRLVAAALVSGLLLLTHYWSFYLLAAVLGLLAVRAVRATGAARRAPLRVLGAVAAGGLLFVPWVPTFLDQLANTGTPWGGPSRPAEVVTEGLIEIGGGPFGEARTLGALLAVFALLALFGRTVDSRHVELDLRTRPAARPEAIVLAATVVLGTGVGFVVSTAFASRYLSVVFPLLVLLVGLGISTLGSRTARGVVLVVLAVLGVVGGGYNVFTNRTQGGEIARAVNEGASPGDVVAVCPDQLGPSVTRHLRDDVEAVSFPDLADAATVDWRDYADRQRTADPAAFAQALAQRAGDGTVWLAWAGGYRGLERACEDAVGQLSALRVPQEVVADDESFEHGWLFRYPAP